MKTSIQILVALGVLMLPSFAEEQSPLQKELSERIQRQRDAQGSMKSLYANLNERPSGSGDLSAIRTYSAFYEDQPEVVVEEHTVEGIYLRKDYHLHKGKVYAYLVEHHKPSADGKNKRIAENGYVFDSGKLIGQTVTSYRVATDAERDPDLARKNEKEFPIPEGLDAWQDQLTARAWTIVHRLRTAVGDDEDYINGLMENAPKPAESKAKSPPGWMPTADTLTLPVHDVISPDGRLGLSWGYEKGPVDWSKLLFKWEHGEEEFSTKLVEPYNLPEALRQDTTFVRNAISGKDVGKLGVSHGGERQRFNHDEIIANWSPAGSICIAVETFKWGDSEVRVCWMDPQGNAARSQDLTATLHEQVQAFVAKSNHPASVGAKEKNFMVSTQNILVEDDGNFEARCVGNDASKQDGPEHYFEMIIQGKVESGSDDRCKLSLKRKELLPPIESDY